jgi:DNA-binding MurR/RpiR family transcriptional regulator
MVAALSQFRPDVAPLVHPGQTQAEGIAALGPDDVAVIIGLRRRAGFGELVAAAAATGAKVLLIADGSIQEAPAHATWSLICAVQTPQLTDSHLGAMAVIRALSLKTIKELGSAGRRRHEAVETLHETLAELE